MRHLLLYPIMILIHSNLERKARIAQKSIWSLLPAVSRIELTSHLDSDLNDLWKLSASAPAAGRPLSSKELMKMMVRGEKVEVLKYLRSLSPDESAAMRRKLLHGLDVMQHRRNGSTTSSGSESSENEMKGNGAAGGGRKTGDSSEVRASFD
jgi:hypothetical protein